MVGLGREHAAFAHRPVPACPAWRVRDLLAHITAGDPAAVADTSAFEALRALAGRRSAAQLRGWDWVGEVTDTPAAFTWGPFAPRPDDLDER